MVSGEASVKSPILKPPGLRDQSGIPLARPQPSPTGRKPAIPSTYQPRKRRRSCCPLCCCLFCCLIFICIIVALIACGFFYLFYEPKLPVFYLNSFKLTQFNVTAKSDGTYLDAKTTSRIELKNPNSKIQIYYGKTSVKIYVFTNGEDQTELGTADIDNFIQGRRNTTNLKVETRLNNEEVNDGLANKLKNEYKNGDLKVRVDAHSALGLMVEGYKIGPLSVNINCGGITLKRLEDGHIPKCSIQTLKWIKII